MRPKNHGHLAHRKALGGLIATLRTLEPTPGRGEWERSAFLISLNAPGLPTLALVNESIEQLQVLPYGQPTTLCRLTAPLPALVCRLKLGTAN